MFFIQQNTHRTALIHTDEWEEERNIDFLVTFNLFSFLFIHTHFTLWELSTDDIAQSLNFLWFCKNFSYSNFSSFSELFIFVVKANSIFCVYVFYPFTQIQQRTENTQKIFVVKKMQKILTKLNPSETNDILVMLCMLIKLFRKVFVCDESKLNSMLLWWGWKTKNLHDGE